MIHQQELIPLAASEYLKRERLSRKLTLATVASAISLDEKILRDIEEDRASHVAEIYRNGYVRKYARFLDISEDEIDRMLESTEKEEPELRTIFEAPPKRNPVDNWLRATSYVLASLLIGTLAWQFTHEAVRLSQNGSSLHGGAESQESTQGNKESIPDPTGPVSASIASLDIMQETRNDNPGAGQKASVAIADLPEGQSRLVVRVSADSWIEITDADDQELEMDLLRGGNEKVYQGKPPFRILFGSASAVSLSVDGEKVDLKPFTREGVVQMSWPQQLQAGNSENGQD
jgi:cytoskeleton protein RodZ